MIFKKCVCVCVNITLFVYRITRALCCTQVKTLSCSLRLTPPPPEKQWAAATRPHHQIFMSQGHWLDRNTRGDVLDCGLKTTGKPHRHQENTKGQKRGIEPKAFWLRGDGTNCHASLQVEKGIQHLQIYFQKISRTTSKFEISPIYHLPEVSVSSADVF